MAQSQSNADETRFILRDAIQNGVYSRGSTLPSTRELATKFDINRNTAAKIYQEMAGEDLIELRGNRPPIVVEAPNSNTIGVAHERLQKALRPLLQELWLAGLTPDEVRQAVAKIVDEFFASYRSLNIHFAECNEFEAQTYAQDLRSKLGVVVHPILLDQLGDIRPTDIVVTPYFHLQEAAEALGGRNDHLIGLVVTADSSEIARIATMVRRGPLGIVAVNLSAAERLRRLLGFQIDVPMMTAAIDQPETMDAIRGVVACVVCTARADRMTWERIPDVPTALIQYRADDHSIELLRKEIQRLSQTLEHAGVV